MSKETLSQIKGLFLFHGLIGKRATMLQIKKSPYANVTILIIIKI